MTPLSNGNKLLQPGERKGRCSAYLSSIWEKWNLSGGLDDVVMFPGLSGEPGAGRDSAAPGGLGRQLAEGDGVLSSAGCCKKSRLLGKWGRETLPGLELQFLLLLLGVFFKNGIYLFTENSVSSWSESVREQDQDSINLFSKLKNEYGIYERHPIWAF